MQEELAPAPARTGRMALGLAGLIGLALLAAPLAARQFLPASDAHLVTRFAVTSAAVLAMFSAGDAARRSRGSLRWGWALLALTATAWSVSNLVAAYAEAAQGRTLPVPSPADVPAASAIVFGALAVLSLLGAVLPSTARMRALLDGLLIASALLFIAWELALRELYVSTGGGPERALALGYPLGDVAIMALLLVSSTRLQLTRPWLLLMAGFGLHSVSHAAFAYLEVGRAYDPGVESVTWIAGTLLIALAALPADATFERRKSAPRAGTPWDVVVPLVPLALCLGLATRRLTEGPLGGFLLMNLGVIVVLLVARQLLAQVEYLGLYRQLEASVLHGVDVLTVVAPDGRILQQTGPTEKVLGHRAGELVGSLFGDLIHPNGRQDVVNFLKKSPAPPAPPAALELMLKRGDGEWTLTNTTVADLRRHPDVGGYLLTSRAVGGGKALDAQLEPESLTDRLTGLGNRVLFLDRIRRAVERSALTPELLTVVLMDVDGFSELNDTLGHAAGDLLLIEVATRLRAVSRKGDTLARLGNDEFGILLERADREPPNSVADRVLARLQEPFTLHGRPVAITASLGVAKGNIAALTAEDLLRSADLALGRAKSAGKAKISVFKQDMHTTARRRVEVESDLRRALENDELLLHFQPIVDLPSGRIAGAEALMRWNQGGRITTPAEFIAVAEESDLVISLGRWVVREACLRAEQFQASYTTDPPFFVSVNLSGRQLMHPHLLGEVHNALQKTQLAPSSLVLEITEGALSDEGGPILDTLNAIKRLGVLLAIDDFGTGWSSLSRLRTFPVDKIKIDRPFIADIRSSEDEGPLLAAIVAMAHSLGVTTIAEGVETVEQLAFLWRQGCESAQGFGVYRPVPAEELEQLLGGHALMLEAIPLRPLSADSQSYLDVISAVAKADAPLYEVAQPLLQQILRITSADAVFLTQDDSSHVVEQIRCSVRAEHDGALDVREGLVLSLSDSPSNQARRSGEYSEPDLRARYPNHDLTRLVRAASHIGVPVTSPDGYVFGTLCVSSSRPDGIARDNERLIELLARLLGNHPEVRASAAASASGA